MTNVKQLPAYLEEDSITVRSTPATLGKTLSGLQNKRRLDECLSELYQQVSTYQTTDRREMFVNSFKNLISRLEDTK